MSKKSDSWAGKALAGAAVGSAAVAAALLYTNRRKDKGDKDKRKDAPVDPVETD